MSGARAPDHRVASVWRAVRDARRAGVPLVVLAAPEEREAARCVRGLAVCTCGERPEPHFHVRPGASGR